MYSWPYNPPLYASRHPRGTEIERSFVGYSFGDKEIDGLFPVYATDAIIHYERVDCPGDPTEITVTGVEVGQVWDEDTLREPTTREKEVIIAWINEQAEGDSDVYDRIVGVT